MKKNIFTIINFLVVISLIVWMILPNRTILNEQKKKQEIKTLEKQTIESYFQNLKKLNEESQNYQKEISKVDSAIPQDISLHSFAYFLQKTASVNGLIVRKINLGQQTKIKENPNMSFADVGIDFLGNYLSFKKFFDEIEKSSRFIEIQEFKISSGGEAKKDQGLEITVRIYSYSSGK